MKPSLGRLRSVVGSLWEDNVSNLSLIIIIIATALLLSMLLLPPTRITD